MLKRDFLAGVIALGQENPKRFLSLIRQGWPEIKAAIDQGHTLKAIHQRLVDGGVGISYRSFTTYVQRLRDDSTNPTSPVVNNPGISTSTATKQEQSILEVTEQSAADPYETIREHLQRKPPGFHWDEDLEVKGS